MVTTAFVLSGGASLGAIQVGMLQALAERQVAPDLLVGTSVGAVNAAYLAGRGAGLRALDDLAATWVGLRRRDVFPLDPLRHLLALGGNSTSLFSDSGLRRLVTTHLTFTALEDATTPVHVVATNVLSGEEVLLSTGDAVSAVLASTAIPGVLPVVQREGLSLVDGGLANNTAISQAVALGADRVFVLPTGVACALAEAPRGALAVAVQALSFLIQQRLIRDVADFAGHAELHVAPPLCPLAVSPLDFRHAADLIERARQSTGKWFDAGMLAPPHAETILSLHHHRRL